jgi:hypothetical protein
MQGYVPKAVVIDVMQRHGVEVTCDDDGDGLMLHFIKGQTELSMRLVSEVDRRILQKLKRTFNVPIHHFYHPLMAPAKSSELTQ